MKRLLYIAISLLSLALGLWLGMRLTSQRLFSHREESDQVALLEQVRDVLKLAAVEGRFTELYDYKDYWIADWKPFTKKALIRVQATVSVGYDLEDVVFDMDTEHKILHVRNLPLPSILYIDHDLDYYDLQQGSFNTFTTEDYNKLNQGAKDFIRGQVAESTLYDRAEAQMTQLETTIKDILEMQDWQVEFSRSAHGSTLID